MVDNIFPLFQDMYSQVPGCKITTAYYIGFVYMMMRRYHDAINTFSDILMDIQRNKVALQNKAQLYDQVHCILYTVCGVVVPRTCI